MTFVPVARFKVPAAVCPSPRVFIVRHTEVSRTLKGVCYGQSDVALSDDGVAALGDLANSLCAEAPSHVVHSGLVRTTALAERISEAMGVSCQCDTRLQEMNFGDWEMRSWLSIYADVGSDMDRILSEPDTYAPGGGETLFQVRDRVLAWLGELPDTGTVVAASHGGPISILRGSLGRVDVADWPGLVPPYGGGILLEREASAS